MQLQQLLLLVETKEERSCLTIQTQTMMMMKKKNKLKLQFKMTSKRKISRSLGQRAILLKLKMPRSLML